MNYINYANEPSRWARKLGISTMAVKLYLDSDVIDLHTDSFIWTRVWGYRMDQRHRKWLPFMGQVDFPRCLEAAMAGVVWDIPTNPLRGTKKKLAVTRKNIDRILADLGAQGQHFQHVVSYADYRKARSQGKIASWISLQGGQAIDNDLDNLDKIPEVHRITLVHFTKSRIGASNADPLNWDVGLSPFGKDFVAKMVENRILVDLSHINRRGFFDALGVMPDNVPPIVTHTGVKGVYDCWRNIDDDQIKAIAERGGTIGVIYHGGFLAGERKRQTIDRIIDHMAHIIQVAGEDFVSLGSDYDGMIVLPRGLRDMTQQPVLVQKMLDRKWTPDRIRKILGQNFLRVVRNITL